MLNIPISFVSEKPPSDGNEYFANNPSKCDASKYHVFSIDDAKILFGQRDIYIWGAGQKGRGFCMALLRCGFKVKAFLDSNLQEVGEEFMNIRTIHPNTLLNDANLLINAFVLTASVESKNREMYSILEQVGLIKGKDYVGIQTLSPFYPTIEVAGLCNLKCSSCIRSDSEIIENGKYMSLHDYSKVINKMVKEIPFLYLVDLYVFGEPLLNNDLPDIITLNNELGIASGLSTNLNNIRNLEAVMLARPAQLRVSLSGASKETYEVTHTGGRWDKVSNNLIKLGELSNALGNKTIIEIYFHIYQHNKSEIKIIADLCKKYSFRFHPSLAVLFSDYALSYSESGVMNSNAKIASDLMLVDIDTLLDDCKREAHLNCILTRIVPVINWDLSVMPCCNYTYSSIAANYLDIKLEDIINKRTNSGVCAKCQKHSLHRWNNQIAYSSKVKQVVLENNEV
jgi:MoaA/NifB/PqqE/SkfB family radical SAM enzyme